MAKVKISCSQWERTYTLISGTFGTGLITGFKEKTSNTSL